jgi:uncharacterized protein (DUF2384 family)
VESCGLIVRFSWNQILNITTFGSKLKADSWLNKENLILSATPISLANSDSGLLEVKKILSAISNGGVI